MRRKETNKEGGRGKVALRLRYPDVARAHKSVCAHTAIFHTGRFCNLCLEIETGQNMQASRRTSRAVELISDIRGYDDVQNEFVLQYHPGG